MSDIHIRVSGRVGRITFTRPKALNAMSYEMCVAIENALDLWVDDDSVRMLVVDAEGEKAFCAGGDIAELYATGLKKDYDFGRKFWADEYRMNAKLFEFPKPVASFMQGYTMGGGVGVGCLGSHRVVGTSSQIAMPECGIGLVPDVGGSYLLANAPGRLGEYFGLTADRMTAGDAIKVGFADYFIPETKWPDLISKLESTGDWSLIDTAAQTPPEGPISAQADAIAANFDGEGLRDIVNALKADPSDFAATALDKLSRNSPLSMGCAIEMIHRVRTSGSFRKALSLEYRFTYRSMEQGDLIEGIRAQIIDKDRTPNWKHTLERLPDVAVSQMLLPLGAEGLTFEKGEKA